MDAAQLLGPAQIRELADQLGLTPTKKLGQNFVHDPNTVRKIVRLAGLDSDPGQTVLEIGPGLGSLTLGLTEQGAKVVAVEIDPRLATQLPRTVAALQPEAQLSVITEDALRVTREQVTVAAGEPTALVANLPYNVSVPILLHLLAELPTLRSGLVMAQQEVGERIAATPGSKAYGAPSVKAAWYGHFEVAGTVSRQIFWPVPNVDSNLVRFTRHATPLGDDSERERVFALVNTAFTQRRKMVRQSLKSQLADPPRVLAAARVSETARAEDLTIHDFLAISRESV